MELHDCTAKIKFMVKWCQCVNLKWGHLHLNTFTCLSLFAWNNQSLKAQESWDAWFWFGLFFLAETCLVEWLNVFIPQRCSRSSIPRNYFYVSSLWFLIMYYKVRSNSWKHRCSSGFPQNLFFLGLFKNWDHFFIFFGKSVVFLVQQKHYLLELKILVVVLQTM